MWEEEEQTERGVCETRLCNCSDIFIESPPSLSCVRQRASLMPVDGESSRGAVFSIIPEAIVRGASERLTVASWDFTKTQQNTRRRGWDRKIRAGGGVRVWKGPRDRRIGSNNNKENKMHLCQILHYRESGESNILCVCVFCWVVGGGRIRVVMVMPICGECAACAAWGLQRDCKMWNVFFQVDCTCWPSFRTAIQ